MYFTITELDVFYEKGAPKPMGADSLGSAINDCSAGAVGRGVELCAGRRQRAARHLDPRLVR